MRTNVWIIFVVTMALLLGLRSPSASRAVAQSGENAQMALVVVVSRELGVRDIPMAVLRRAFSGDTTELNGQRIVPLNYAPKTSLRVLFDQEILDMNPQQVGLYWIDRRIRGQGMPPRTVSTQALVRGIVPRLPGAIGYVTVDQLGGDMQALRIDGKDHRHPDYPLRVQ